ncbi:hypothetical protein NQ318_001124 [Aromia moschata]|uniref:Mos1 transposase HTH domain-containing protein n=1 Tax=Aromia moschata TaxID=1265417 RepID=A0AAV8ZE99_9CUCU|nr:hypothetical protein NQ318_001124 [Aromia moschata]
MLKEVYGNESLSRTQVFEWFKWFKERRETTEDDPRPERPFKKRTKTLKKLESTMNMFARFCMNRSICAKFTQKIVPKLLAPEPKESRMNICADILNNNDTDPGLLDTVTLKRTRFESVVTSKATEVLNQLTEADFQHCFRQWKSHMERCRNRQGEYIEGEKVATRYKQASGRLKLSMKILLRKMKTLYVATIGISRNS